MDRTSRTGIFLCLALLIALVIFTAPPPKPPSAAKLATPASAVTPNVPGSITAAPKPAIIPVIPLSVPETWTVLENDALKVTLTSRGAAIQKFELKEQAADDGGHIVLNQNARSNVMQLTGWPGADAVNFQIAQSNAPDSMGVTYYANLPNGLRWERRYAFGQNQENDSGLGGYLRRASRWIAVHLGKPAPKQLVYTLDISDTLTNPGAADVALPDYSLSVGRAEPLLVKKHFQPGPYNYPGSGWLAQKFRFTTVNDFNPGYVPLVGIKTRDGKDLFASTSLDPAPLQWLSVENQFFAVLLTPAEGHPIHHAVFQCFNQRNSSGSVLSTSDQQARDPDGYLLPGFEPDIEAAAFFPAFNVPAGKTVSMSYGLYAGPKDYNRLDSLGANQGELMYYDGILPFSLLIVPMLSVLHFWYLIFSNYGVAIILLTLMIKAITWPLQSFANKSGKRMQALAPKLKELQAKYKEQPEKLQTETFAMYKDYGVNPFGGCVPALVQMPIFFSLYFMLQNAVELRGQSFLWVKDLTQPDTVFSCLLPFSIPFFGPHLTLNLLPIMVTGLTMVMMRMTPQMGDPSQAKIAQWMPMVFLFIFYNFAAALSLYYVINNAVSIIQIYRNLKKPLPELVRKPRKKAA